jgi:hypothetical protein
MAFGVSAEAALHPNNDRLAPQLAAPQLFPAVAHCSSGTAPQRFQAGKIVALKGCNLYKIALKDSAPVKYH